MSLAPPSLSLRVLLVDDCEDDAVLVARHLRRAGFELASERVDTAAAMREALVRRGPWDAVVCDFSIPGFGALPAVQLVRTLGIDVPFIVVSGAVGEETAVECMRAGVHDFVLKGNLARLAPAIERERDEARRRDEQRRTEAQLRVAEATLARGERLRALGQMAAGIAHDLKNILNPIALQLQVVDRAVDRGLLGEAHDAVAQARAVLARGVETVDRLREFSRQSPEPSSELVDLDAVAREAAQLARPRLAAGGEGSTARIVARLGAPPRVRASASELVAAVLNLAINAIDALTRGGTVTLRTYTTDDGRSALAVIDDGPGMAPEVEQRAFEPFFTTKGAQGTGLGLSMVYASVARYGGAIELATGPGRGTTFTLSFPAAAVGGAAQEPPHD